ncbi:hypothetical protein [Actinacidiphila sp. bgisy145]|uniref:hypothetical protein n=1 Tax=Actinacidiphila sp. bgisy145 TaxID=3413792 RepID=UPI003EB85DFF
MSDGTERAGGEEGGGGGEISEGGDPVCWLDRVCEECGAFRETAGPDCARCGTPFPGAVTPPPPSPSSEGPQPSGRRADR